MKQPDDRKPRKQSEIDNPVAARGYLDAVGSIAELESRLRVPEEGGLPTDPGWTESRSLPMAPRTIERLERMSALLRADRGLTVGPMQIAALLIEQATDDLSTEQATKLVKAVRGNKLVRRRI